MNTNLVWNHCRSFAQWFVVSCLVLVGPATGEDAVGHTDSRETLIRVSTKREGGVTSFVFENLKRAPVTVSLTIDLVNLEANIDLPSTITLSPEEKRKWVTLSQKDISRGWTWSYTYYSTLGDTKAEHDDSFIYMLPYAPGKSFRITQGYNGEYSHFGSEQYAIDWRMPLGTPVHAARGGMIVGVKDDSDAGGNDSKYDWDANYVIVEHADKTLGQYVHLEKGSAAVKVGQRVEVGDLLGLSGNTGHSTGPHLHFSVFKARDGKCRQTIATRFKTADNEVVMLVEGRVYKSPSSLKGSVSLAGTSTGGASP